MSKTKPTDEQGKPKICDKCTGADKDKPIVGLVIIKDLGQDGDHWKGGTILDPDDGKVIASLKGTNLTNETIQQHIFGDILKISVAAELRFFVK